MNKVAKTHWVWTDLAESLHPDRKAGTPVYEHYRHYVPRSWHDKGYVIDAEDCEGQVELAI